VDGWGDEDVGEGEEGTDLRWCEGIEDVCFMKV
jgi:hypothetical protein